MKKKDSFINSIPPVYNQNSKVLIVGSFPSVVSRKSMFFYGHPQNRFWPMIAQILNETKPQDNAQKRELALKHGIALWDIVARCEIKGSADSSLNPLDYNDLSLVLSECNIRAILINGGTAHKLYLNSEQRFSVPVVPLPSTSPANASYNMQRLFDAWSVLLGYLN